MGEGHDGRNRAAATATATAAAAPAAAALAAAALTALATLAVGCARPMDDGGATTASDAGPDAGATDAAEPPPPPCSSAADCDDGLLCNGLEQCNPFSGCMLGPVPECDDADPCTTDVCDEGASPLCRHDPVDSDGDGDGPAPFCGGDCDDADPAVSALSGVEGLAAAGTCANGVDDDCDGTVDLAEPACLANDTCATATVVTASATLPADTTAAAVDGAVPGGCFGMGSTPVAPDVFYELDLASDASVTVTLTGAASAGGATGLAVALLATCGPSYPDIDCAGTTSAFGASVSVNWGNLGAGTYWLEVFTWIPGALTVDVAIDPPGGPGNDTCAEAVALDVASCSTVVADLDGALDDTASGCGDADPPPDAWWLGSGDVYYTFTLTETSDVVVNGVSTGATTAVIGLRSDCADAASEAACLSTNTAAGWSDTIAVRLDPGTYWLVVSTSETDAIGVASVTFSACATPAPPVVDNDTCAGATVLLPGVPYSGSLAFAVDDYAECWGSGWPERVHRFSLPETRDVLVEAVMDNTWELRAVCDPPSPAIVCLAFGEVRRVAGLAAGDYTIAVSNLGGTFPYTLTVDSWRAAPPSSLAAADRCDGSDTLWTIAADAEIASQVGAYDDVTPTCGGAVPGGHDAFYMLSLAAPAHVFARTLPPVPPASGSEDFVLGVLDSCSGVELACGRPRFEADLPAGDWLLYVDQPASGLAYQPFTLVVNVTP
ncbi:MAG TPA: hypothetical protein VG389_23275 [Myxococcota bacterium]|jgi:hypothetical protein|nr:hypothetical protein [Myxococcota bacterium]